MKQRRTVAELQQLATHAVERGAELRELRQIAGVSYERAARWLRLSVTMIFNFEAGTVPINAERYASLKSFYFGQLRERQKRAAEIAGKGTN